MQEEFDAKREIAALRRELERLNREYYDEDRPSVEDAVYDRLMQRLHALEAMHPELARADSPTATVGGTVRRSMVAAPHRFPMLSLQDVFEQEGVIDFVRREQERDPNARFVVEQKIDGLSVSLRYRDGVFVQGLTRGDGITSGEDVTLNLRRVIGIVERLVYPAPDLELRGEVYLPIERFHAINALLKHRIKRRLPIPETAQPVHSDNLTRTLLPNGGLPVLSLICSFRQILFFVSTVKCSLG